uniref:Zinc finger GATA like protein 1 n=1 Tax=Microcebus murinus TaxID=30608 RepID=A0A8C5VER4_MICMU
TASKEQSQVGTPQGTGSLWPACQDSVSALHFLQVTAEELAQPPAHNTQALGPCWEPMSLGTPGPLPLDRDSKTMQTQISKKCHSLDPTGTPQAPPKRRSRKQPNPRQGAEKVDPRFQGVTLKFQIKPDSSLQIVPTYSQVGPSHRPPTRYQPFWLTWPRCCASCRTQTTPLWRDAEDGTPLCNACGIRYKKYGIRCSGCWLVPRKSVQPGRLCGRCGVALDPHQSPAQAD